MTRTIYKDICRVCKKHSKTVTVTHDSKTNPNPNAEPVERVDDDPLKCPFQHDAQHVAYFKAQNGDASQGDTKEQKK